MAFARQADDAELDVETQDGDFGEDYDGFFEEIDFAALGIDPVSPTHAKPGSEDKVRVLAARYAAGLPLWHNNDCYDHGPARDLAFGDAVDAIDEEEELEEEAE